MRLFETEMSCPTSRQSGLTDSERSMKHRGLGKCITAKTPIQAINGLFAFRFRARVLFGLYLGFS